MLFTLKQKSKFLINFFRILLEQTKTLKIGTVDDKIFICGREC